MIIVFQNKLNLITAHKSSINWFDIPSFLFTIEDASDFLSGASFFCPFESLDNTGISEKTAFTFWGRYRLFLG
jgi:hypothetical protein